MNNHMILLIMIKLSCFSHINTVQHGALASWSGGFHGGTHGRLLFLTRKAVGCCGADPDDPGKIWKFDKMSEIFLHIAAAKAGIENPMDRTLRIYKGQGSYKWLLLGKAFIQEHVRSYISIQWPMKKKMKKYGTSWSLTLNRGTTKLLSTSCYLNLWGSVRIPLGPFPCGYTSLPSGNLT